MANESRVGMDGNERTSSMTISRAGLRDTARTLFFSAHRSKGCALLVTFRAVR
jgi:hypothetical protein